MSEVLLALALLACPLGMGAMMWFMMRGMGGRQEAPAPSSARGGTPGDEVELQLLRHEVDQLRTAQQVANSGNGTN